MSPDQLRAYVLIFVRDILIPGGGVWIALHHPATYMLPLIAGMLGVPLVGRDKKPDDPPAPAKEPLDDRT